MVGDRPMRLHSLSVGAGQFSELLVWSPTAASWAAILLRLTMSLIFEQAFETPQQNYR